MEPRSKAFDRLMEEISESKIVDIHSHIDPSRPSAKTAADILLYHYLATELRSAGVPEEILSEGKEPEQRAKGAVPYMRLIRNTTTYWCLKRILEDIYGFEGDVTESNYPSLRERIVANSGRADRAEEVLRKRGGIRKTFLTFDYATEPPDHDPSLFAGALRIEPLIGRLSPASLRNLSKSTGRGVETMGDFEEALTDLFKKFRGCVAVTASFLPSEFYVKPDRGKARSAFENLLKGGDLAREERNSLSSYALGEILERAAENRVPFQMMVGVTRPVPGASPPDLAITAFEPGMLLSYCQAFHEFKDVEFDVFLANRVQSQELTVIAKNYPNVHVSGYWWYNLYPSIIREILRERLQMLPANKINGFFSDAYVVEWSYGKACLVKSQVARVLAEMVEDGFYSIETAKELATDLLERNPAKLYGISRQ
ncbi:MAG: hypothetical protein JTT11_05265 [Candidatus Brockarchaeota archaeon]|nr:hypothetical protein [Candidatus Brockarchaeota archaeon]